MLIHNKDDIEFVTEFPRFLGHPVLTTHEIDIHGENFKIISDMASGHMISKSN